MPSSESLTSECIFHNYAPAALLCDIIDTGDYKEDTYEQSNVAVCNAIIVQLSRIMSILLPGNVECILECFKPV